MAETTTPLGSDLHLTADTTGGPDDGLQVEPGQEKQTLKFHFTPRVGLAGEVVAA